MLLARSSVLLFLLAFLQHEKPVPAPAAAAQPSFQIAGVVVDSLTGQPLSRTQVVVESTSVPNAGQSTTTGDDGRFLFDNVAPGKYSLSAQRRGYLQQLYKQHEFFSTAIVVGPDLDTSHLRFPLPPDASISGQILDETNDPVRNAQVILFQRDLQFGRRTTWQRNRVSSDDQGRYRFGHLAPGTYFVATSAQPWYAQHGQIITTGYSDGTQKEEWVASDSSLDVVYPITFFSNSADVAGAVPITLHPGDTESADLTLRPVPAVHLTVSFTPSGKPDEPESVWPQVSQQLIEGVQEQVGVNNMQVRPGLMEITGLPPGHLSLTLHSNNGAQFVRSTTIQARSDSVVNISDATGGSAISGVVKMDDGSSTHESMIGFHNRLTGEQFTAQVQDTGEFALHDQSLAPGTYNVFLGARTPQAVRSMSATGAKVTGRAIEVVAGQDVTLSVIASRGTARITGIALKDGKPLDGVMVVLVPEVAEHNLVLFRRDQSDSDGSFVLRGILPGKYTILALENGWDLDWFTPGVLQKYLPAGEAVTVTPNAKLEVKVKVQP